MPSIVISLRSEIDHLTALLLSRTDDNSVGDDKERLEPNASAKEAVHNTREILNNLHALENGAERVLPAAISTPVVSSKVGNSSFSVYFIF